MKYAIVGYGRMGREIEAVATRRGHELVAVVDPAAQGRLVAPRIEARVVRDAAVAFEFTSPAAAENNVAALVSAGVSVVCGTTGWHGPSRRLLGAIRAKKVGVVLAPNFSLGMHLFFRIVETASCIVSAAGFHDPFLIESHHRAKIDAPSGTARLLAELVRRNDPRVSSVHEGSVSGQLPAGTLQVASVRAGHEPGTHTVGFDGEHDVILLTHRTRGRSGMALGAVLAGEWIASRSGFHGFDDVVRDLLSRSGATGRARPTKPRGSRRGGRG